jgi:hypothetical protein
MDTNSKKALAAVGYSEYQIDLIWRLSWNWKNKFECENTDIVQGFAILALSNQMDVEFLTMANADRIIYKIMNSIDPGHTARKCLISYTIDSHFVNDGDETDENETKLNETQIVKRVSEDCEDNDDDIDNEEVADESNSANEIRVKMETYFADEIESLDFIETATQAEIEKALGVSSGSTTNLRKEVREDIRNKIIKKAKKLLALGELNFDPKILKSEFFADLVSCNANAKKVKKEKAAEKAELKASTCTKKQKAKV